MAKSLKCQGCGDTFIAESGRTCCSDECAEMVYIKKSADAALSAERAKVEALEAEVKRLGLEMNTEYWYAVRDENAKLRAEVKRLREVVERLPKTADGVPVVPGMEIWSPRIKRSAVAGLRAMFDHFPIYAHGWAMNVDGSDIYSTEAAAARAPAGERKEDGDA